MPPSRAHRETRRAARQVPLRVPVDSPWRDGLPLPAQTAKDAVSQLVWRVHGPLPARVKPIIRWVATGALGDWSPSQLAYWTGFVRLTGRRTPLQPAVAAQLTLGPPDDPAAVRRRSLFGLPEPNRARSRLPRPEMRIVRNATTAVRVLAAVGALTTEDLLDAHRRARQYRSDEVLNVDEMALGITYLGASYDASSRTWTAPTDATPASSHREVLAVATPGVIYRRTELISALVAAGLSGTTAHNRVAWSPLLRKVGHNRYQVRTTQSTVGPNRHPTETS